MATYYDIKLHFHPHCRKHRKNLHYHASNMGIKEKSVIKIDKKTWNNVKCAHRKNSFQTLTPITKAGIYSCQWNWFANSHSWQSKNFHLILGLKSHNVHEKCGICFQKAFIFSWRAKSLFRILMHQERKYCAGLLWDHFENFLEFCQH